MGMDLILNAVPADFFEVTKSADVYDALADIKHICVGRETWGMFYLLRPNSPVPDFEFLYVISKNNWDSFVTKVKDGLSAAGGRKAVLHSIDVIWDWEEGQPPYDYEWEEGDPIPTEVDAAYFIVQDFVTHVTDEAPTLGYTNDAQYLIYWMDQDIVVQKAIADGKILLLENSY